MAIEDRMDILSRWNREKPKAGLPRDRWFARTAEETGHSEAQIRTVISREATDTYAEYKEKALAFSAQAATVLGVTLVDALEAVARALHASETMYLRDGHGNPIEDPKTKEMVVLEKPMYPV